MPDKLKLNINSRERELILQYGYPFKEIKIQLDDKEDFVKEKRVTTSSYWWELLAGELARSLNHDEGPYNVDQEEIDELLLKLDTALTP